MSGWRCDFVRSFCGLLSMSCVFASIIFLQCSGREQLGMCKCWACTNRLIGLHLIANGLQLPLELALGSAMLLFAFGRGFLGIGPGFLVLDEVVSAAAAAPANRQLRAKCYLPFCCVPKVFLFRGHG